MLIGPFKNSFEMDQSASSIVKLGQVMLVRVCYVLTNEPTWSLTNQRARSGLKGQHAGFLDVGHLDTQFSRETTVGFLLTYMVLWC